MWHFQEIIRPALQNMTIAGRWIKRKIHFDQGLYLTPQLYTSAAPPIPTKGKKLCFALKYKTKEKKKVLCFIQHYNIPKS